MDVLSGHNLNRFRLSEGVQYAPPPQLRCFTIPGGARLISQCDICRTVCRRAERAVLRVTADHGVDERLICYLNRLSDYFYTLGRASAQRLGVEEKVWNV